MAVSGCRTAVRIERQAEELRQEVENADSSKILSAPTELSWAEAVAMAREKNAAIVAARFSSETARRELENRWKEFLPKLELRFGFFEALASAASSGWTYAVASQLNLPNLANYSYERLGAVLAVRRAELTEEIAERHVLSELYQLFCEDGWLRQEEQLLTLTLEIPSERSSEATTGLEAALRSGIALNERRRQWESKMSELLGEHTFRWAVSLVDFPGAPTLGSDEAHSRFRSAEILGSSLALVEWEGARLRSQGVKLRYWPNLYTFLSTPNLYGFQGGANDGYAVGQVSAGAELGWQLASLWEVPLQSWSAGREEDILRRKLWQQHWRRLRQVHDLHLALDEREAERVFIVRQINVWSEWAQLGTGDAAGMPTARLIGLISERIRCERQILAIRLALFDSEGPGGEEKPKA